MATLMFLLSTALSTTQLHALPKIGVVNTEAVVNTESGKSTASTGLDGSGDLLVTGAGYLVINGTSTNTGSVSIGDALNPGLAGNVILTNTGSIGTANSSSSLTVNPTGTLLGAGTVYGTVTNNGRISPGTGGQGTPPLPIGTTLTIGGDYTQTTTGLVILYANESACYALNIIGTANFNGGTISLLANQNAYTNLKYYTILRWNGQTGTLPTIVPASGYNNGTITTTATGTSLSILLSPLDLSGIGAGNTSIDSLTNATTNSITINENANIVNISGAEQSITKPIIFNGASSVYTDPTSTTVLNTPVTAAQNSSITFSGGGTTSINADNSETLQGNIIVNNSTLALQPNSNLGTAAIELQTGTLDLKGVSLVNSISVTQPSTIGSTAPSTSILSGPITGSNSITINSSGNGKLNFTGDSQNYTGSMSVTSGAVAINADFSQTPIIIHPNGTLGGTGKIRDVMHYGVIKPGNSIGTLNITGDYTTSGAPHYYVEINANGQSSRINVTGTALLAASPGGATSYTADILMNAGTYEPGVINYTIFTAEGGITGGITDITWTDQTGLSFTAGPNAANPNEYILKATITQAFTIAADQTTVGGATLHITNFNTVTILPTDRVYVAPVADSIEQTNIVFNSTQNNAEREATKDTFRFKSTAPIFSSSFAESFLAATAHNGPISVTKNETRVWISPFVNRSRTNTTAQDVGNQGWSGGSLTGIERRDRKNTWSFGLLTGLTASKSHLISQPSTNSKTTGVIGGFYNTYKYTNNKNSGNFGHELLASRTRTFIDAKRLGITPTSKDIYNATSKYKTTTDLANGQLNYIFDFAEKKYSCRLSSGLTYIKTSEDAYREQNAGANGLIQQASSNKTLEFYNGIGLRRIWNNKNITVRTTVVYEYGYAVLSEGAKTTSNQSATPTTFTTPASPRQNKHYLQLNGSYLDHDSGVKFALSYAGVFYKNVENHTCMLKAEYRF